MMMFVRTLGVATLALATAACSSFDVDEWLPDKQVAYKREKAAERNLEVPPDLTSGRINDRMSMPDSYSGVAANYSEYQTDRRVRGADASSRVRGQVLPENTRVTVQRDGDARWLVIDAGTDAVWDRMLDFWEDQGVLLQAQDPELGIMRTAWLDNRATISRDIITDSIRSVFDGLYETGQRDQYRLRFERLGANRTEIFMTHYGMQEQLITDQSGDGQNTVWAARPRDPELEVVMLRRMMVFLGAADERARAQLAAKQGREQRSRLVDGRDGAKLVIGEEFARGWRLVGLALDRVGFAVEDRDRKAGIYYVRYNDPAAESESEGWLSSLKFWGDDKPDSAQEYQVHVKPEGGNTVVRVMNAQGVPGNTNTDKRILTLVHEQIR